MSNIRHLLDLSTLHVPGPEPDWGDLKVTVHEYGWVVRNYYGMEEDEVFVFPEWIKPILKIAAYECCEFIWFDADAPEWDDANRAFDKPETFEHLWSEK